MTRASRRRGAQPQRRRQQPPRLDLNRTDSCSRKKEAEPDPRRRHASSIRFPLRALPCSPLGEPLGPPSFLLLLQLGRGLRLSLFRCGHTGPPGCRTPHAPCTRRFLYRAFNLRLLSEGSPAMPFRGEEAPNLRRTRSKRIEILEKETRQKKKKKRPTFYERYVAVTAASN